jgi:uncharacterized protein YpmB
MNKKIGIMIVIVVVILLCIGLFTKKERKVYNVDTDKIDKILVVDKVNKVKIKVSEDDKIHVTYSEGMGLSYHIEVNNGLLEIKTANNIKITLGFDIHDNALIIEVPKDFNKELDVKSEQNCSVDQSISFSSKNIISGSDD